MVKIKWSSPGAWNTEERRLWTLGLNENQTIDADIYPNPTTNEVNITFESSSALMIIRDAHGKMIQMQTIQSGESISLENIQNGIYFFELTTEQGKTVKRVVKQ